MTNTPKRAVYPTIEAVEPLELSSDDMIGGDFFDQHAWTEQVAEERGASGRTVLGWALALLAAAWLAYSAWSAGRYLAGSPLSSPVVAQWVAVAAGPLALLGLVWLMFGRTRRKEAERFTRSVGRMRAETRSLEALLEVLSQRIDESQRELVGISRSLMDLGDQTTEKLGGITRSLDESTGQLRVHGEALDRAAQAARVDIGVLLEDLPRAESIASGLADQMRTIGAEAATRTDQYGQQVARLIEQSRMADEMVSAATASLSARLGEIETAGVTAKTRIDESEAGLSGALDLLLERTSVTLAEIRNGIDVQAEAVRALVDQASAGIGKAGADSAASLAANVSKANSALLTMSEQIAERETASRHMLQEIERGLALIDQRFTELSSSGDERANHFLESLTRARGELDLLASSAGEQDVALGTLAERTEALQSSIGRLVELGARRTWAGAWRDRAVRRAAGPVRGNLAAGDGLDPRRRRGGLRPPRSGERRHRFARRPARGLARPGRRRGRRGPVAPQRAGLADRFSRARGREPEQPDRTGAGQRPAPGQGNRRPRRRTRARSDRGGHPGQRGQIVGRSRRRAREGHPRVGRGAASRGRGGCRARRSNSARAASERLTGQMLAIGQTASALEAHMEQTREDQREKDSEAFARRVALLIDSMHSAAIDVGKILSDEIDDKAWSDYMKGDRAVFTRRAVRLIGASEARPIRAHYDSDMEFRRSTDRYVHDFEAMLRRVVSEREGGMMAVALMSSDMGKLYAALAQAIDKRR